MEIVLICFYGFEPSRGLYLSFVSLCCLLLLSVVHFILAGKIVRYIFLAQEPLRKSEN